MALNNITVAVKKKRGKEELACVRAPHRCLDLGTAAAAGGIWEKEKEKKQEEERSHLGSSPKKDEEEEEEKTQN